MKKILILNGPNINLLGMREPGYTGMTAMKTSASKSRGMPESVDWMSSFQSNGEGELIDRLHACIGKADGVVFNAGAYTHSYATADAISAIGLPVIEVHMSNIHAREEFRHTSVIARFAADR